VVAETKEKTPFPWKGFTIKDGDYSMTFGVQLQGLFRYDDEDFDFSGPLYDGVEDTDIDPLNDFEMRRARISLSGGAFARGSSTRSRSTSGSGRRGRRTCTWTWTSATPTGGGRQFKKPYDLFDLYSSKTLMFIERPARTSSPRPPIATSA